MKHFRQLNKVLQMYSYQKFIKTFKHPRHWAQIFSISQYYLIKILKSSAIKARIFESDKKRIRETSRRGIGDIEHNRLTSGESLSDNWPAVGFISS